MYYYRPKSPETKGLIRDCLKLKHLIFTLLLSLSVQAESLKFSILSEPVSLSNTETLSYTQHYLFDQLHRSFFTIDKNYKLVPELVKNCEHINDTKIKCMLKKNIKFSDKSPIYVKHFLNTFSRLIKNPNKNTERLKSIKGYSQALQNKDAQLLQVQKVDNYTLIINLNQKDQNFLYNFSNYTLAPSQSKKVVFSGPFYLKKWDLGNFIELNRNPYYEQKAKLKSLKVYFIKNPSVALKMYEKSLIDLLTFLPTNKINDYRSSNELIQIPLDRFDYIGLEKLPATERNIIAHSIKYEGLQKLYQSLGIPGCPGLSDYYFKPFKNPPCHAYSPAKSSIATNRSLTYSLAGGADISKGMQYIKNQIESHTNIKIKLNPVEPGQFISSLKSKNTELYRRGVALNTPDCYKAVEFFHSSSYRNYSKLKDKKLDSIITALSKDKKLCYKAVQHLIQNNYIIPLGKIQFYMLLKPEFKGFIHNSFNQIDLRFVSK